MNSRPSESRTPADQNDGFEEASWPPPPRERSVRAADSAALRRRDIVFWCFDLDADACAVRVSCARRGGDQEVLEQRGREAPRRKGKRERGGEKEKKIVLSSSCFSFGQVFRHAPPARSQTFEEEEEKLPKPRPFFSFFFPFLLLLSLSPRTTMAQVAMCTTRTSCITRRPGESQRENSKKREFRSMRQTSKTKPTEKKLLRRSFSCASRRKTFSHPLAVASDSHGLCSCGEEKTQRALSKRGFC